MSETLIELTGLHAGYGGIAVVRDLDLTVRSGEVVALLGPNGAGKTTTLLMLLGAITPDQGSIEIAGHQLPRGRSQAMESVGFAAGSLPLPDRLKVSEALRLFAGLYGVRDERATVAEGMARFGIEHLADKLCEQLSSGQRTLVGITKAILHRPRLLVLDEPTASLDPDVAQRVRTCLLQVCAAEGTALLVTSHDMREVELLCERVVFLAKGRVVADGSPGTIADQFGHADLEGVFLQLAGQSLSGAEEL